MHDGEDAVVDAVQAAGGDPPSRCIGGDPDGPKLPERDDGVLTPREVRERSIPLGVLRKSRGMRRYSA